MSFVGKTKVFDIVTSSKNLFKLFITEQMVGYSVATILYSDDGVITTKILTAMSMKEVYDLACEWIFSNIDESASIQKINLQEC